MEIDTTTRRRGDTAKTKTVRMEYEGYSEDVDRVVFDFQPSRREFVQVLGAGLIIAVAAPNLGQAEPAAGAGRGGRGGGGFGGGGAANIAARLHIARDGAITVMSGKVECGQGARTELAQAAAEELRVPFQQVSMILGDTGLCPDDGGTYGSMTTPRTVPPVRQAAAAARNILIGLACATWGVQATDIAVADGKVTHAATNRQMTYADLAQAQDLDKTFTQSIPANVTVTPVNQWKVLGTPVLRPNARDVVIGRHPYPSDQQRPGMLYGKVLRAASYGATLTGVDLSDAKAMQDVVVVHDGNFVGVAAPSMALAQKAIDAVTLGARWTSPAHPASKDLAAYLRQNARVPANPAQTEMAAGAKALKATYYVPYIQHAPLEPRAAVAEWVDGKLTVWTGSQTPFQIRQELVSALRVPAENVRVIVNDFGGGFGGKHTGECAVEAARLARSAGKPVSLRWTREEEFTWAAYRPAGVIDLEASLDAAGRITSWYHLNINSGGQAVQSPYAIARATANSIQSAAPLRQVSYRGLAATANIFAREAFMDELAQAAGKDPLEFRLAHLQEARLRAVLETVAQRFNWPARSARKDPNLGVGLACGTEKGSYVATCAEVAVDREAGAITVRHLAQVFECGKILNPAYLLSQVQGSMIQGLGPVLREEMVFEDGRMQNASFREYRVPRFADVPTLDIFLLDRPDLASAGGGETPLMGVAPAITNAVSRVLGQRLRGLPLRIPTA